MLLDCIPSVELDRSRVLSEEFEACFGMWEAMYKVSLCTLQAKAAQSSAGVAEHIKR